MPWAPRQLRPRLGAVALALVAFASLARGAPDVDPGRPGPRAPASGFARHLQDSPSLLGNPGGVRSRLAELGIRFRLFYNQFVAWKPSGGRNPSATDGHSGSYDFFTLADAEQLVGWPGLQLLLHVKGQYDRNINADVGALGDPIDDADFDEAVYVDELWAEQSLFEQRVRLRLGFQEQQTVFDRNAFANSEDWQFMNTFLDNNALVPLPNALAANLLLTPLTWLELAVGTADADNRPRSAGWDTAFDSVESLSGWFELRIAIGPPGLSTGSYRLGLFVDGRRRTVFGRSDPVTGVDKTDRGWLGVYASFDQWLYREPESPDQGLGAFARFAWADPRVNAFDWFWSLGAQYTGLLPRRDADVLGIGSYQTIGSQRYQNTVDPDFDRETGVEVYYRVALLPWLHITPGFQYIIDPGASKPASDAVVVALRIRTTF